MEIIILSESNADDSPADSTTIIFSETSRASPLDISSTSSHQTEPKECQKWSRCGRSDCSHCSQIESNKRTHEVLLNVSHRKLYRLVLTVKSVITTHDTHTDLKVLRTHLYDSFARLRRQDVWKTRVQGGLYRFHVTYPGHWHPHLDIMFESAPINKSDLSKAWEQATGGSFIIKLQSVKDTDLDKYKLSRYILKPPFKSIAHDESLMEEYNIGTRNCRKYQRFGTWQNTRVKKDNWKRPERKRVDRPKDDIPALMMTAEQIEQLHKEIQAMME